MSDAEDSSLSWDPEATESGEDTLITWWYRCHGARGGAESRERLQRWHGQILVRLIETLTFPAEETRPGALSCEACEEGGLLLLEKGQPLIELLHGAAHASGRCDRVYLVGGRPNAQLRELHALRALSLAESPAEEEARHRPTGFDLGALGPLPALEALALRSPDRSVPVDLRGMPRLRRLFMTLDHDVAVIGLDQLESLELLSWHAEEAHLDLRPIRALHGLCELRLSGAGITGLDLLGGCPSLERLSLSTAWGIPSLNHLSRLRQLQLNQLEGYDLRGISQLNRLEALTLWCTRAEGFEALEALSTLPALKRLTIHTRVPLDLSPLAAIEALEEVVVYRDMKTSLAGVDLVASKLKIHNKEPAS